MNPFWWALAVFVCATGSGLLVYFIMQARVQVVLANQRELLAEARAGLAAQKEAMEGTLKSMEESTKRKAMDEFLADVRVEERHYIREHKLLFITRKCLVRQERIFFRNIPLSSWVENEMPFEEGADTDKLAQTMAVFSPEFLLGGGDGPRQKVLRKS
ncbi:MAG: hypothetical protein M3Z23_11600 [Acidobacteriota bacterium]|nr:hypothetical protein [Acidobacteriota bacterium]